MNWYFEQKVDLKQPSRAMFYAEPLMVEGDNLAHEWRVHVFTCGQPMDLTGYTITGYFDRSDGKMVPVTGTAEGSLATVVLPQSVYVAAGPLSGLLRAGKDGQIITLAAGRWNVRRGPGDEIVDPGQVVPSLEELLAKIGEMERATNAAETAAQTANTAAESANDAAASVDAKVESAVEPLTKSITDVKDDLGKLLTGSKPLLEQCIVLQNNSIGVVGGRYNLISSATEFVLAVPISLVKQDGVAMLGVTNATNKSRYLYLDEDLTIAETNTAVVSPAIFHKMTSFKDNYVYVAWSFANDTVPDISAVATVEFAEYINSNKIQGYRYEKGLNLIKENCYSHGYYSSNTIEWSSSRISTNLMQVLPGQTISFNRPLINGLEIVCMDSNYTFIRRAPVSLNSKHQILHVNSSDTVQYIYVTMPEFKEIIAVQGTYSIEEISAMSDLDDHIAKEVIPSDLTGKNSSSWNEITRYKGKHYSALGDSLTAPGSGGTYLAVTNQLLHTTCTNCGIGGTRVSGSDDTDMWTDKRINDLDLQSDFVVIMGGSNDVGKGLTVTDDDFTMDNHDTNNFVGAYNVMISKIIYKFMKRASGYYPEISYDGITQVETPKEDFTIVLITPPKIMSDMAMHAESEKFADYVNRIGKMWGIPVVDSNANMFMSVATYKENATDKVHFGAKWHNRLGRLLVSKLKEIEPLN